MPLNNAKVALVLCGGDIKLSDLPITTNRSNAMIPVNGKPVIGWILDDLIAKHVEEVILVLRFDNYKLFNYVEWAFNKRITIHYAFVQTGGTILHSLLAGLAWVKPDSGVHIVLGDTLLRDPFPTKPDFIFSADYENPEDWCLVETNSNGIAEAYFDKVKVDRNGLRALTGVYSLADSTLLRNIVMDKIRSGSEEISHVLAAYGKHHPIAVLAANEWYDFGHISYFNLAKQKLLQSRYFNSLTIDSLRGTITKQSEKSEKLSDELGWYKALPEHLQLLCPRIITSEASTTISISQEYYGYPTLAELYVFGDISPSVWTSALKKLMEIHDLFRQEKGNVTSDDVQEMYWQKTQSRVAELSQDSYWKKLLAPADIVINSKTYANYSGLTENVQAMVSNMKTTVTGSIIHGDFCFSNILYDLNTQLVRLIDPRGSFGKQKLYGDPRYDVAKLRHSISGRYDYILADLFWVKEEAGKFEFQIFKPEVYDSLTAFFDGLLNQYGYSKKEVMFIEGLLFVSMVPLHRDNFQRQLAMYLTGVMILNQVFEDANSN